MDILLIEEKIMLKLVKPDRKYYKQYKEIMK